jgi:NAD(P)H dehydrogenase (quinone)
MLLETLSSIKAWILTVIESFPAFWPNLTANWLWWLLGSRLTFADAFSLLPSGNHATCNRRNGPPRLSHHRLLAPKATRYADYGLGPEVLLIAGTDEEHRLQQHQNVVNVAKKAGVQWLGYTSRTLKDRATMANQLMEGHFQTEDAIKVSGLAYSLFRNVLYLDAIPQFVGAKVAETGIYLPAGQGKVPFALRRELGEAIANVMATDTPAKPTYQLTGRASYSFAEVAAALTDLFGKPVKYTAAEVPAFEQGLKARGLPEVVVGRIIGFMTDIKNGQEDEISPDLEQLLGRQPATLHAGLKELYNL